MNNKSDSEIVGQVPVSGNAWSSITLKVNGAEKRMEIETWTTLLDALRECLYFTGTKNVATTENAGPAPSWYMAGALIHA
jgi:hypothetical protein